MRNITIIIGESKATMLLSADGARSLVIMFAQNGIDSYLSNLNKKNVGGSDDGKWYFDEETFNH